MKGTRLVVIPMIIASAMLVGGHLFGQNDTFSGWTQVTGQSKIQFRWKASGGKFSKCDIELRDLDEDDRRFFQGTTDYVNADGKDETESIVVEHFSYAGQISRRSVLNCSRVSDVLLRIRQ